MEVVVVEDTRELGRLVGQAIADLVGANPTATLGLATGSSPLPVYTDLKDRHVRGEVSFAEISAFLLDEYVGLEPGHPQSYRRFIEDEFSKAVGISGDRLHGPDIASPDVLAACLDYEATIRDHGGIDLQLLGIGTDGHIGFNEPTSSLASRTRLKTLTAETRRDNQRFFGPGESVPVHVVTQGLGTILEARHLVLVASGENKANAIRTAIEGPVTAMCPASVLQLHPHATVVLDEDAAASLSLADYYRETYANKPAWQHI